MDDLSVRLQTLERGHAVHEEKIGQLKRTDERYATFLKWATPIALTLLSGALTFQANETRALTHEVRSLVTITARMEEWRHSTDEWRGSLERRLERIEGRHGPVIMSE